MILKPAALVVKIILGHGKARKSQLGHVESTQGAGKELKNRILGSIRSSKVQKTLNGSQKFWPQAFRKKF